MINLCLNGFMSRRLLFRTFLYHCLFRKKKKKKLNLRELNCGWAFIRGNDNRKTLIWTSKSWSQSLNRSGWLISCFNYSVLPTIISGIQFPIEFFSGFNFTTAEVVCMTAMINYIFNNFGILMTGPIIRGGR